MVLRSFLFLLVIMILVSCDGNYRNVVVTGIVTDRDSNRPIANAKVTIKCWVYDTKTWESTIIEKATITGINGEYSVNFEKGEAIDVTIEHKNATSIIIRTLKRSTINLSTEL